MSNEVTACGRIVKDNETGRFIEVTLKPAFYELPIDQQYSFLCKSRKDFLKETKHMKEIAEKKLKEGKL